MSNTPSSGQINSNTPILEGFPESRIASAWFRFLTRQAISGLSFALPELLQVITATYAASINSPIIAFNYAGVCTVTLPDPKVNSGIFLFMLNYTANAVNSATANVVSLTNVAGTAILAATAGKWAILQSDGTNWNILAGN